MAQTGVSRPVVVAGESCLDALFASASQGSDYREAAELAEPSFCTPEWMPDIPFAVVRR